MHRFLVAVAFVPLVACATGPVARNHVTSHPNGEPKWQVSLVDGVPDGPSVTWHENGQVASRGMYRAGRRDGEFDYWDERGNLVRREVYRADVLVSSDIAAPAGPSTVAPVAVATPEPAPADHYTEVRFTTGMGGTNAAHRLDSSSDGGEVAMSLSGSVLVRRGTRVFGVTSLASGELFGASHNYLGAVFGLSSPGDRAVVQLLAEGGMHVVSDMGDDLFATAQGESAVLPYLGSQLRLSLDPGERGHLVVDLSLTGRTDLGHADRDVMVESCFFGCTTERETWRAGGHSVDVALGLGYRF